MAATGIELIRPDWPAPARVHGVSTTRIGGVSRGCYASLNLGAHVGDEPSAVARNRALLEDVLALPAPPRWLDQVHGTVVVAADAVDESVAADAAITSSAGTVCAIQTADCLPVLFTDRAGGQVAAVHGGWRGLVAGILEQTIDAFAARGVSPDQLMAWLGPAIGPAACEVDAAVVGRMRDGDNPALARTDATHWQLDLTALARLRLAERGVTEVFGGDFCTHTDSRRFFSYRRDGTCGRQATLIWID